MGSRRKITAFAVVASIALFSTAINGVATGAHATSLQRTALSHPQYGGTMTMDVASPFPHLDPALAYDNLSYEPVLQMYDQLLTYKGTTNDLVGDLAARYTITNHGTVYTFWLRKASFWNGDPVTANSFITEFERVLNNPQSGGQGFIDPIIVGSNAYQMKKAKTISGMKSLDGGKVLQITLTGPDPTFGFVLAMPFYSAVDPAYIAKHPDTLADDYMETHPMGTGPFELSQTVAGQQWVLTRNPHYFKAGLPYLNKLVFNLDSSPESVLLHFEQGSTDLIGFNQDVNGVPEQDYLPLVNSKWSHDLYTTELVTTNYIGLNTKVGPTKNLLVRQALEYAVNKKELLRIEGGRGVIANQPLPNSMPSGYNAHLPANATYTYNPAKARQLLKEARYHGQPITLYTDNGNADVLVAQALQSMFKAVGVNVNAIRTMAWNVYIPAKQSGKLDAFLLYWAEDFPDPSDFLNTLFNSSQIPVNDSVQFSDPKVDALLNKAQNMPEGAARDAIYKRLEGLIMAQAPWIPYLYPTFTAAVQPWVHGYYVNPNLEDPFQVMWVSKH